MHYIELYLISMKNNLKSLYEYRFDFWIGLLSFVCMQLVGLLFIWLIFQLTPSLAGWTMEEVVFIYGLQEMVKSLYLIVFGNVRGLEQLIRHGRFDRYLIRPAGPLFQLMMMKFNLKGVGSLVTSLIIFKVAADQVGLVFTPAVLLLLISFLVVGVIIYFSLSLITTTTAFWLTRTLRLHQLIFDFSEFTRYPIDIFHQGIQLILSVVIPFALASYYPASYLLQRVRGFSTLLSIWAGSLIFCALAYSFWRWGLKYYHSTGS